MTSEIAEGLPGGRDDDRPFGGDHDGPRPARRVIGWFDVLVVGASFAVWKLVMEVAIRTGVPAGSTESPWGRWDTGLYRAVAENGYTLERCVDVPNRGPEDFCGTAGWFPGYPYSVRAVTNLTGASFDAAARWIAVVAWIVTLALLWFGFLRTGPRRPALAAMALAAVFPAAVYYGAMFPISLVTASVVGALVLLQRRKWLLAGLVGTVAVVAYPSGILVGVSTLAVLLSVPGPLRGRLVAGASFAAPLVVAYGLVLANFERAVGRWDAWFRVQESYGYEPTMPTSTIADRIDEVFSPATSRWIGIQTVLALCLVIACVVVAARRWREFGTGERAAVFVVIALWFFPLTVGGDLSLYRAESLLLPAVVLVRRAPAPLVMALAVVAAPVTYNMAQLYFSYKLG